jgi:hypothetical protein
MRKSIKSLQAVKIRMSTLMLMSIFTRGGCLDYYKSSQGQQKHQQEQQQASNQESRPSMQRRGRSTAIATLFLGWRQGESGSSGSWLYNRHGTGGISGKEAVQRGSEGFRGGAQRGGAQRGKDEDFDGQGQLLIGWPAAQCPVSSHGQLLSHPQLSSSLRSAALQQPYLESRSPWPDISALLRAAGGQGSASVDVIGSQS